jgi:hypothetical protein
MKNVSLILCLGLVMSGCSSTGSKNTVDRPNGPDTEPYVVQELTTRFDNDGLVVKSECLKRGITLGCKELSIKSIEATVTVNSNGGTNALAVNAITVGKEQAKDEIVRFFGEEITSDRVVQTIMKNIEKGNDRVGNVIEGSVEITDVEALGDTSVRENSNDYERIVTTSVRSVAKRKIAGLGYNVKTVDDQLMRVTAIWTRDTQSLINPNL